MVALSVRAALTHGLYTQARYRVYRSAGSATLWYCRVCVRVCVCVCGGGGGGGSSTAAAEGPRGAWPPSLTAPILAALTLPCALPVVGPGRVCGAAALLRLPCEKGAVLCCGVGRKHSSGHKSAIGIHLNSSRGSSQSAQPSCQSFGRTPSDDSRPLRSLSRLNRHLHSPSAPLPLIDTRHYSTGEGGGTGWFHQDLRPRPGNLQDHGASTETENEGSKAHPPVSRSLGLKLGSGDMKMCAFFHLTGTTPWGTTNPCSGNGWEWPLTLRRSRLCGCIRVSDPNCWRGCCV